MTDAGPAVRPARPADARAIARIQIAAWRDSYADLLPAPVLAGLSERRQAALWRRTMSDPEAGLGHVFVAGEPDIVGFGSARRTAGELATLYVRREVRGRGVGRALFAVLSRFLDGPFSLWVADGNPAAGFYERLGGRVAGRRTTRRWGVGIGETEYAWGARVPE